jgi:hypothetical protein
VTSPKASASDTFPIKIPTTSGQVSRTTDFSNLKAATHLHVIPPSATQSKTPLIMEFYPECVVWVVCDILIGLVAGPWVLVAVTIGHMAVDLPWSLMWLLIWPLVLKNSKKLLTRMAPWLAIEDWQAGMVLYGKLAPSIHAYFQSATALEYSSLKTGVCLQDVLFWSWFLERQRSKGVFVPSLDTFIAWEMAKNLAILVVSRPWRVVKWKRALNGYLRQSPYTPPWLNEEKTVKRRPS